MQNVFRGILKADWTNVQEDNPALAMRGSRWPNRSFLLLWFEKQAAHL